MQRRSCVMGLPVPKTMSRHSFYYRVYYKSHIFERVVTNMLVLLTVIGVLTLLVVYANVFEGSTSYIDSPYWLETPRKIRYAIVALQVVAVLSYMVWLVWVSIVQPPSTGPLTSVYFVAASVALIFVPAVVWPVAARKLVDNRTSIPAALFAALCLVLTAIGVGLQTVGTFRTYTSWNDPPRALILPFLVLTAGADAFVWNVYALRRSA